MPNVLISTDTVKCLHAPGAATNVPAAKLKVQGKPVLTDLGPVVGCSNTVSPATPCLAVAINSGKASKLKVGGTPVLLGSLAATAAGSPGGALSVVPVQIKLMAV